MISIFNGRERKLGGSTSEIFAQINVDFRQHLHLLKGARLGVFLAISLHANAHGWAWPSRGLLSRETGYNINTISRALSNLCKITISNQRLLLRHQSQRGDGTFESNQYLIFPSPAEVLQFENCQLDLTGLEPGLEPCTHLPYTVKPCTENLHTKKNHLKEEYDDDDSNRRNAALPIIQRLYAEEIGKVTPGVHLQLTMLTVQYPDIKQWYTAFDGVIQSNVRRLDYLTTCLKNVGKPKILKPG